MGPPEQCAVHGAARAVCCAWGSQSSVLCMGQPEQCAVCMGQPEQCAVCMGQPEQCAVCMGGSQSSVLCMGQPVVLCYFAEAKNILRCPLGLTCLESSRGLVGLQMRVRRH